MLLLAKYCILNLSVASNQEAHVLRSYCSVADN